MTTALTQVTITIGEDDGSDPIFLDHLTRQLVRDLQGALPEAKTVLKPAAPQPGAMAGDPITLGAVAVAIGISAVPALIDFLKEIWSQRQQRNPLKVTFNMEGVGEVTYELADVPLDELKRTLKGIKAQTRS